MNAVVPLQQAIIEALSSEPHLTREQLLDLTFSALERALSDLIGRKVIRLIKDESGASHLDRVVLA
jgi:hypothetical protein